MQTYTVDLRFDIAILLSKVQNRLYNLALLHLYRFLLRAFSLVDNLIDINLHILSEHRFLVKFLKQSFVLFYGLYD